MENHPTGKRGHSSKNPEIISYQHMQRAVGFLAIFLPVLTSGCYALFTWQPHVLDSISEYNYTIMRDVFVGTLSMVALFLYAYKGYNDWEDKVFNFAALLCLLIAFFGMNPKDYESTFTQCFNENVLFMHHTIFGCIHIGSASILFITLGYVSHNLFTKTDKSENPKSETAPTKEKLKRNRLYITCGLVIWISLAFYTVYSIIALILQHNYIGQDMNNFPMLFIIEWICLWAFGFSWLTKGEGVPPLNDGGKNAYRN